MKAKLQIKKPPIHHINIQSSKMTVKTTKLPAYVYLPYDLSKKPIWI